MASRQGNGARVAYVEKAVEPTPSGPVRRQINRILFAAVYGFWIFAAISFAVGTVNFWLRGVIPWPISQAAQ